MDYKLSLLYVEYGTAEYRDTISKVIPSRAVPHDMEFLHEVLSELN